MSSVFRIYGLKACFYGSPNDMFYIEHLDRVIGMNDARSCRTYIENNIQSNPRQVYEFLLKKLKMSGYDMAFFEDGGASFTTEEIRREMWRGDDNTKVIRKMSEAAERDEVIKSISSDFWGSILAGELFNARY